MTNKDKKNNSGLYKPEQMVIINKKNVFQFKEQLKKLGGEWDDIFGYWFVPFKNLAKAEEIVNASEPKGQ